MGALVTDALPLTVESYLPLEQLTGASDICAIDVSGLGAFGAASASNMDSCESD